MKPYKASAHAKAILSGEHAVLYGANALITPLKDTTSCSICPHDKDYYRIDIPGFKHQSMWRSTDLKDHLDTSQQRLKAYQNTNMLAQAILPDPSALAVLVLSYFQAHYNCFAGADIVIESTILPYAGMGSSSALIASMVKALLSFYQLEIPFKEQLEAMQNLECYQHGKSSGIDLYVSYKNTACRYQSGTFIAEDYQTTPGFVCFSGHSKESTAQCVAHAKPFFKDQTLVRDFQHITTAIHQALISHNQADLIGHIQKNHALLCQIGVVPDAIQKAIALIEQQGAAAKICGAGALSGKNAGLLWIVGLEKNALPAILSKSICFDL